MSEEVQSHFWKAAVRRGLPRFRFLRRSLAPEQLDRELLGTRLESEWLNLKGRMQPGDRLWPFEFSVREYLGNRRGYVALRKGKPIGGVVTVVS